MSARLLSATKVLDGYLSDGANLGRGVREQIRQRGKNFGGDDTENDEAADACRNHLRLAVFEAVDKCGYEGRARGAIQEMHREVVYAACGVRAHIRVRVGQSGEKDGKCYLGVRLNIFE